MILVAVRQTVTDSMSFDEKGTKSSRTDCDYCRRDVYP
jgi:hypothetical protein